MKKLFAIFIILLVISGCGGGDDPYDRTAPIITDVIIVDIIDGIAVEKTEFNIDDKFDILIYATDPDLDIESLFITEYCPEVVGICNGPAYIPLPKQVGVKRGYHFTNQGTITGPTGDYRLEFQIEDYEGHLSNIFEVFAPYEILLAILNPQTIVY